MRAYWKGNIPAEQRFTGQAALIMEVLPTEQDKAMTAPSIASAIKDRLVTRQGPDRVVAFYMSSWLKRGWLRYVDVQGESGAAATPVRPPASASGASIVQPMPLPAPAKVGEFPNLTGKKLSEAVLSVLEFKSRSMTADEVTKLLNEHGYEFHLNQVHSAIQNLIRKEAVTKVGDKISIAA